MRFGVDMAGLAIVVCVVVVGFGYYLYFRRWRYEVERDRRGFEDLRREIERRAYSSRLTPTLDEMPYNPAAADRRAFIPDDGRPESGISTGKRLPAKAVNARAIKHHAVTAPPRIGRNSAQPPRQGH